MTPPDLTSLPQFYRRYVEHVKDYDLFEAFKVSSTKTISLVRSLSEEKGDYRYAPGKWTIKELLCHMLDTERILSYRALRFARNDKTPLHGFEENDYAPEANAHGRTIAQLAGEMERLRAVTLDLYTSFTPEMLSREGTANKGYEAALTAVVMANLRKKLHEL